MKSTVKIGVFLNTSVSTVREILSLNDISLKIETKIGDELEKDKNIVYGFVSSEIMLPYLPYLINPPILWENPCLCRFLSYTQPLIYLDAKPLDDGTIFFLPLNTRKLLRFVKKKFKFVSDLKIEKQSSKRFGNSSKLSCCLNDFLFSIPEASIESFLVCLATAIETQNYKTIDNFVKENRMVTNENRMGYIKFNNVLSSIKEEMGWLVKKDLKKLRKIKDKNLKSNLGRVRFILKFFGTQKYTKLENQLVPGDSKELGGK